MKVKVTYISTGRDYENETITLPDNATNKEIEEAAREIAFNEFEWGYEIIKAKVKKRK